jgi:hypothetical protein
VRRLPNLIEAWLRFRIQDLTAPIMQAALAAGENL